jgi:hypothetical protein
MAIVELEQVRRYTNEAVVLRFLETWDLPRAEADELFDQMLKWLWLGATLTVRGDRLGMAISQSTKLIDEMWHTFVLFSRDYVAFCDRHFGFYLHHDPTPQSEYARQIAEYERDPQMYLESLRLQFARQYEVIYDLLGEETLVKWYSDYLNRYSDEFMREIWRWSFSPYDTRVRASMRLSSLQRPVLGLNAGTAGQGTSHE